MGKGSDTESAVSDLKDDRFGGANGEAGPVGPGVFIMAAILVAGIGGVLFFGPTETVSAVRGFINSSKATPQETTAEDPPESEPKPARPARTHRDATTAEARPALPKRAVKLVADAKPLKKQRRTGEIRLGMARRELLELFGAPDMKTTSLEAGHLVENFSYMNPSQGQQSIVLEDGLVVATGGN